MVQYKHLSMDFEVDNGDVYVKVYFKMLPLSKFFPKMANCIKTLFDLFFNVGMETTKGISHLQCLNCFYFTCISVYGRGYKQLIYFFLEPINIYFRMSTTYFTQISMCNRKSWWIYIRISYNLNPIDEFRSDILIVSTKLLLKFLNLQS